MSIDTYAQVFVKSLWIAQYWPDWIRGCFAVARWTAPPLSPSLSLSLLLVSQSTGEQKPKKGKQHFSPFMYSQDYFPPKIRASPL